eukprot:2532323-Amphidinium_carterae.1
MAFLGQASAALTAKRSSPHGRCCFISRLAQPRSQVLCKTTILLRRTSGEQCCDEETQSANLDRR